MARKRPLSTFKEREAKAIPLSEKKVLRDTFCYPSLGRDCSGVWGGSPPAKSKKTILFPRVSASGTNQILQERFRAKSGEYACGLARYPADSERVTRIRCDFCRVENSTEFGGGTRRAF